MNYHRHFSDADLAFGAIRSFNSDHTNLILLLQRAVFIDEKI